VFLARFSKAPAPRRGAVVRGAGGTTPVTPAPPGDHALYKVGQRLEERGMLPLLQAGLQRESLNGYRLGHILDALFAANLNRVFSTLALKALDLYTIPTPWLHQGTMMRLYGAYDSLPERRPQRTPPPWRHALPMAIAKMDDQTSSRSY